MKIVLRERDGSGNKWLRRNVIRFAPPLIINEEHVDEAINIIDKKRSLQRIHYEQIEQKIKHKKISSQKIINPHKVKLNKMDIELIKENQNVLKALGYIVCEIKNNYIQISAIPSGLHNHNLQELCELFLEELKLKNADIKNSVIQKTALNIASNMSLKHEILKFSNTHSLQELIQNLLKCKNPFIGIDGKPCVINIEPNTFFN